MAYVTALGERAGSHALLEPSVVLTGRACELMILVLADVLRDNRTIWALVEAKGLTPADVDSLRAVARDLREVILAAAAPSAAKRGESATSGEDVQASSVPVKTATAAELLGLAPRTVRGLAMTGEIEATKVGRGYVFDRRALATWQEGRAA